MLDAKIRTAIDPLLDSWALRLTEIGIRANTVTLVGFAFGLLSLPFIAMHQYGIGLLLILINRFCDGLDGAIARQTAISDVGAYLDIVLDFIVYSGVVFAFSLAQPENAIFGAFLIFSFIGSGTSFLAFAIFAEKQKLTTEAQGTKSIYYLSGLAEGFETILALVLMCLLPQFFWLLALGFAIICWVSTAFRIASSIKQLAV